MELIKIKGKLKEVGQPVRVTEKFTKAEIIIETDPSNQKYPNPILIEFTQDNCDCVTDLKVGQEVTVNCVLNGREWVNPEGISKYFNSVKGLSIDKGTTKQQKVEKSIDFVNAEEDDFLF
jgi:hypothetical protein